MFLSKHSFRWNICHSTQFFMLIPNMTLIFFFDKIIIVKFVNTSELFMDVTNEIEKFNFLKNETKSKRTKWVLLKLVFRRF